jgi:hypothetical protein
MTLRHPVLTFTMSADRRANGARRPAPPDAPHGKMVLGEQRRHAGAVGEVAPDETER